MDLLITFKYQIFFSLISSDLFYFCPKYLWHFEYVPIKCPKQFSYWVRVEGHVQEKFKSEFHFCSWFPGLQNLDDFLENLLLSKFWNHFQAEIIPWSPIFLDFLWASSKVWKNEKSCQSWFVRFWVNRCSKTPIFSQQFFFSTFQLPYWFETLNSIFSNIIPGVSTC